MGADSYPQYPFLLLTAEEVRTPRPRVWYPPATALASAMSVASVAPSRLTSSSMV
jgi:hypothetical protein